MPRLLLAFGLCLALTCPAAAREILASGSTFAYPILSKWSEAWEKVSGTHFSYQPIGSSAGVTEVLAGVVDVGVSDAPLVDAQLLRDGLAQFPIVIGAIVPIVNLPGIAPGQLRFTGPLLAEIYLGKIRNWNDPAIAAVNPEIKLPDRPILVIYRSDGSGTSYNWADFLSKVSPDWNVKVGVHTKPAWPIGVGVKGSRGIADSVARVSGAIGYVEYSYALRAKLSYGLVRNQAGHFVQPDAASFRAAADGADWAKASDFFVLLSNGAAPQAYPVMAMSFVLIHRFPKDIDHARNTLAFFRWAIEQGQEQASSLLYLPLPPALVREVEGYWDEQILAPR